MDISLVTLLNFFYFIITSFLYAVAEDNHLGLCVDPMCSELVGIGLTMSKYSAPDANKISFMPNERFEIFLVGAGPKKDLFGVQMGNRRGYIPQHLVRVEKNFKLQKELVPAQIDFLSHVSSNYVNSQLQYNSDEDPHFYENSQVQYNSAEDPHLMVAVSDSSSLNGGNNYHSDLNSAHSHYPGPNESPQHHHASHLIYSSNSELYSHFDSQTGASPNLEPSVEIHVQSNVLVLSSHATNAEHIAGSHGNTPEPFYHQLSHNTYQGSQGENMPFESTNVEHIDRSQGNTLEKFHHQSSGSMHQGSQLQNMPLESSFSSELQGNSQHSYYSQNSHGDQVHASNFDSRTQNLHTTNPQSDSTSGFQNGYISNAQLESTLSSHVSEVQSSVDSHISFEQPVRDSNQVSPLASNSYQKENDVYFPGMSDTMAILIKQGYSTDDLFSMEQNLHTNMKPSQHEHFLQNSMVADYGHSSSSHFESSNAQVAETQMLAHDSVSSFSSLSNENQMTNFKKIEVPVETSQPFEPHETTKLPETSSESISKDKINTDDDYDIDDEDIDDDEADVEDEEDFEDEADVEIKSQSNVKENEEKSEDFDLPQNKTATFPQSNMESDKLKKSEDDENLVSESELQNIHAQGLQSNPYSSLDSVLSESKLEPVAEKSISLDSDPKNLEKSSLMKDSNDDSELNMHTPLTESDSYSISKTINDVSFSTKSFHLATNNSVVKNTDTIKENLIGVQSDSGRYATEDNENLKTGDFLRDGTTETTGIETVNETDSLSDKLQGTELDKVLNISELSESEKVGYLNPYQIRNLKEEIRVEDVQNIESDEEAEDNATYVEFDFYGSIENSLEAIRSIIEVLLSWIPEPLFSIIMDLQSKGISPRVPVFTAISSIPCILLIIVVVYIKEKSSEKKLIAKLALSEKNVYMLSAEKTVLEEKIEKTTAELKSFSSELSEERSTFEEMKTEVESLKQYIEKANQELESNIEEIDTLKEREKEYVELVSDHEKAHLDLMEEKIQVENKVVELEETISSLHSELQQKEKEIIDIQKQKSEYLQSSEDYEEKLSQLQQNCNQLLKEAEVWNIRVNELSSKLSEETSAKVELESELKLKDSEIESLKHLVQTLKSYEELEVDDENESKSNEEKLKCFLDSSNILVKLEIQEEENKALLEKLSVEKNKILEMEVELLEAKSESDKLKLNYNQALQDKAEAQTKLDVLTNYFKDKEIQMQKQIGAQEAVRERREKDADSAERRICLIEQENTSYKYQVASMKQEMEETERNLKSQIATQEKKAHENWIAARAAERKLEDMKQEVTQLRQRLTLLEREQENWLNSSRDDIIRPVPKRISGKYDDLSNSQDMNNSMDLRPNIFPPPLPMMLPPDRPLPPLHPHHHLPPFLPPPLEPHFRPQPWHLPQDPMPGSEFRITPPDFSRGRESTPPRGRHSGMIDGDMGPRQSSPLGGETRDSRNSTPPHSLPDFHDIPPPPRPFFPPPGGHPRYPLPPPFRRDVAPGPRRTENPGNHGSSGRGTQQSSVPQENWPHSNTRV